ncbi:unnamed protein product, partial [Ectocarpus sp. 6 AP-2014]
GRRGLGVLGGRGVHAFGWVVVAGGPDFEVQDELDLALFRSAPRGSGGRRRGRFSAVLLAVPAAASIRFLLLVDACVGGLLEYDARCWPLHEELSLVETLPNVKPPSVAPRLCNSNTFGGGGGGIDGRRPST